MRCFMIYIILIVVVIIVILISNNDKSKKVERKSTINIIGKSSYLSLHINKKYKNLVNDNELNYKKLGIDWSDEVEAFYDEDDDAGDNITFISEEDSSAKYGNLLSKVYSYCGSEFYATIGYDEEKDKYRFTIRNDKIYINEDNEETIKREYIYLKNKIANFCYRVEEYSIYEENITSYLDNIKNEGFDYETISSLTDRINNNKVNLFEIPYMQEVSTIIDIVEPMIIKEYSKKYQEIMDSLPDIEVFDYIEETKSSSKEKIQRKNKVPWKDKEFEKESNLWGLSNEDRRIAKEERMSPADYDEAEENDDDVLD